MNTKYYFFGVLPILLASALWAIGYFLRKGVFEYVSPILVNFLTCIIVVFIMMILYRLKYKNILQSFQKNYISYLGLSFIGVVLGSTFMFLALDRLDLGITTLLEKLQPIFTLFLSIFFLKEVVRLKKVPFILVAISASFFLTTNNPTTINYSENDIMGILYVSLASLCWAIVSIIGKNMMDKNITAREITFLRFILSAIMLLPIFLFQEHLSLKMELNLYVFFIIFLAAFISTTLGYLFYYYGLKLVTATTAGFLELFTPVVAIFLGIFFLDEQLLLFQWVAIPILLYSIYMIAKK